MAYRGRVSGIGWENVVKARNGAIKRRMVLRGRRAGAPARGPPEL